MKIYPYLLTLCLSLLSLTQSQAEVKVSVTLDPPQIVQGQTAILRLSVAGASSARFVMPVVSGLEFSPAGQSSSIQIINFSRTDTVTYAYRISGYTPGTYTIPAILIEAGDSSKQTNPLTLTITKNNDSSAASAEEDKQDSSASAQDGDQVSIDSDQRNKPYFLQMELKKDRVYVGQMVPVTFRLFVRAGMPFGSKTLPSLESELFTIGSLTTKPGQYSVVLEGVPYHLLMWNSSITPLKAGSYELSARQLAEVQDRERVLGGGSSLFDQFMTRAQVKEVELKTKAMTINVLPLPQEGKPASFSGAIGSFTFVAQVSPTLLTKGEPTELTATIEGAGNFERIDWPGLNENRLWRSYKPSSTIKATDQAGLEGKKIFQQALIPLSLEIKEFPMLEFTYFDPEKGQYKTLRSDPLSLQIQDAANADPQAFTKSNNASAITPSLNTNTDPLNLMPNHLSLGATGKSVSPWITHTWWIWALLLPGLIIASILFTKAFQKWRSASGFNDPKRKAAQLLAREIQGMELALQQSNTQSFTQHARRVAQVALAQQWNCPAESVTRHELRQRQPLGFEQLDQLFSHLDAIDYSGSVLTVEEMNKLYRTLKDWLQSQGK